MSTTRARGWRCAAGLLLLAAAGSAPPAAAEEDARGTRFLHTPDASAEAIVFVYGEDLWTAPLAGGDARRLTAHPGEESRPRFSPDGSRIAFSSDRGGNVDVYVMAAAGGPAVRLTYRPGPDHVEGWSPDGARILFSSRRQSDHLRPRLHTIAASGGYPDTFPMHKGFRGAFSPDGRRLAYTPRRDGFETWKRYRGGEAPAIWLVDLADYSHVEVPHGDANDTSPVWMGDSVYFRSDRNGVMSLFRYDGASGRVEELYGNGTTDVDSLAGSHGRLVFSSGGWVHVYDVAAGAARQVPIRVADDRVDTAPRRVDVSKQVRTASLSPDGSQVALEARGELLVVPAAGGAHRNLTRSSGMAERHPAWSPDGTRLAYFSDRGGEYALYERDASGEGAERRLGDGPAGLGYRLSWSPDGGTVAYLDRFGAPWLVDVASGRTRRIDTRVDRSDAWSWSPDGRFLAFAAVQPTQFRRLTLHEVASAATTTVTDAIGDACAPAFARDGGALYFLGSTSAGKAKTGLDLSVLSHADEVAWSLYAVRLGPIAASGAPLPADPAGFEPLIERLSIAAARYTELAVAADGALLIREQPSETRFAGEPRLLRVDPRTGTAEEKALLEDAGEFALSADGTALLTRAGEGWRSVATAGGAAPAPLDLSRLAVEVDPVREWRQMFAEVWRNQRDFFFDEALHGIDWEAMRERYAAWLPDVRHRSDLDFVFRNLVSELVNSHISVRSGDRPEVEPEPVGLLGADYAVVEGRYRIERIVKGTYWDEERGPLAAPGLGVEAGDFILEIDGRDLSPPANIHSLLVGSVGRSVTLRVNGAPRLEGSRVVSVVPIASEGELRRRDWIERMREEVDRLSGGRIAYVYQPDTGRASLREFDRYFFPQSDRAGVIVDERFNDGGDDPDYQLDILDRQQVHWYRNRTGPPFTSPFSMIAGPMVMLVNAEAGSGGDVYPYQFSLRGLGTTVGTRTWGGVNGGGAGVPLVDGGRVSVPNLGTWAPDGSAILENTGFTPDVTVEIHPRDDAAGRDPQLEKAVEIVLAALERQPPPAVPELEKVDRSLTEPPPSPPSGERAGVRGEGGVRR